MNRSLVACLTCLVLLAGIGTARASDANDEPGEFSLPRPTLQPSGTDDRPYWRKNLFKRFVSDQKFLVTTWWPSEARRYDFAVPMVVAIAGASASSGTSGSADQLWQRDIEAWTVGGRRYAAEAFTVLGDSKTAALLAGTTYLAALWAGNERMQRTASLSSEALLNTALYTGLLKRLTRRTRPASAGVGEFFVAEPQGGQEPTSFPSGHATGAFAVAAVFAWEFREKRWVGWVAYGTAGLVAVSRVGLGRHFPSDVLAGAVIGRSIGRMVAHRAGGVERSRPRDRLKPIYEPRNRGFGIGYRHSW